MAGATRLELATSAVTGQRSNQLNYAPAWGTARLTATQCEEETSTFAGAMSNGFRIH